MIRTGNPALNSKTFKRVNTADQTQVMTLRGTVDKTGALILLVIIAASWTWKIYFESWDPTRLYPWLFGGLIGGFITSLVTIFNPSISRFSAPLYAIFEGLFLGGLSAILENSYPGIVIKAVALTFGTLFSLLFLYRAKIVKPTENFKLGVLSATGAIAMLYFASFILRMFGMRVGFIDGGGVMGIGFSLFVVIIAALNLVLDFDFIENGVDLGAPKFMEWYAAFGLLVTLVWLYIEILRLLSKIANRR